MIGIAMGIPSLIDLFQEKYYTSLEGGILESLGRLFKNDLKLYVYPVKDEKTGEVLTVQNLKVAPNLQNLYDHLVENHFIEPLEGYKPENLSHLLARGAEAHPERRCRVGNDGAAGGGRDDQEGPALRLPDAVCRPLKHSTLRCIGFLGAPRARHHNSLGQRPRSEHNNEPSPEGAIYPSGEMR